MVQFSNGFTFGDLYSMPTKWRRFYYNELVKVKTKENQEMEKIKKQSKVNVKR
jgi:hypothetical protein